MNSANPNNDAPVQNSPTDSVSSLVWSPTGNFLAASGWSKESTVWEIQANGVAQPKAQQKFTAPILCSGWSGDNSKLFLGGCDNQARMWNLATNQLQVVAAHSAPIKDLAFINELNLLVTASWDKTLKYWDVRAPSGTPSLTVPMPERVYSLDMKFPVLVVSTAEKKPKQSLYVFDITNQSNLARPYRSLESLLNYPARCLSIFPDKTGFAAGSVEGRAAIMHVHEKDAGKNFAFKCHREGSDVFPVNSVAFHPMGAVSTSGGDGRFIYWDKDARTRLKLFERSGNAITASGFNAAGTIFAYAIGYDWSKGVEYAEKQKSPCGILLHPVQEGEIKKIPAQKRY